MTAWYGCKEDEDKGGPVLAPVAMYMPETHDLRQWLPPVMNQSASGSCVPHGCINAARYYIRRSAGEAQDFDLSVLQLYWDLRTIEGTTDKDEGGQISNAMKTLSEKGVGHDSLWPFNLTKLYEAPPPEIYADAALYKAPIFNRVRPTAQAVKEAIALGHPVVMGLKIFSSFESPEVAATGIVPMPLSGENFISGHCVTGSAFGIQPGRITTRNQWGKTWGDSGDCHFTEEYVETYALDFYVIDLFT